MGEIAQRSRLSLPSVRAALRRLIEIEIVTAIGAGRSMVCSLRLEHPLAPALRDLFEAERQQAATLLHGLRDAAAGLRPSPLALWLYGSVARGEDDANSDIDVALISAESDPTAQADVLRDAVSNSLPGWAHRISVVALGLNDVARLIGEGSVFWRELERDAVVLAGEAPAGIRERISTADRG